MQTKIEIINTALTLLGVRTIFSIDQEIEVARKVKIIFSSTLTEALRSAPWRFATAYETLALLADDVDDADHVPGWDFTYKYPPNSVFVRKVFNESSILNTRVIDRLKDWEEVIAPGSKNKALVSNLTEAQAKYTFNVTDTTQFDPSFDRALAHKLAFDLAIPLTGDKQLQQAQANLFSSFVSEAKAKDFAEARDFPKKTSQYENARGGGISRRVRDRDFE